MTDVAYNVRCLIDNKGLKQKAVAKMVGLPERTVSKLVTGRQAFKADDIERFALALGVTPNDLFKPKEAA